MVEQHLIHLDCDRCGTGWTGDVGEQPRGWFGVTYVSPVLDDFATDERNHLCPYCAGDLSRFLNNKEVPTRG